MRAYKKVKSTCPKISPSSPPPFFVFFFSSLFFFLLSFFLFFFESKKSRQTTRSVVPKRRRGLFKKYFLWFGHEERTLCGTFSLEDHPLILGKEGKSRRRLLRIHLHSFETTPTHHNTHIATHHQKKIIMAPPKEFEAPEHTIPVDS